MKKNNSTLLVILVLVLLGSSCNNAGSTSVPTNQSNASPKSSPTPSPVPLNIPDQSKYESESPDYYGLYYLRSANDSDERKLIISDDDKPIPPKSNDPGEATVPGFYLSSDNRLDFEKIEVIGKKVYFKTREFDGIYYEFRGKIGEEIDPNFSADIPIPFIKGTLGEFKVGKLVRTKSVKFGHAVIA